VGKKLYTVTIEAEIVVVADDAAEAEEAAHDAMSDLSSYDYDISATPMRFLPSGWEMNAIPYGENADDDPDRTVDGWIRAGAGEEYLASRKRFDEQMAKARGQASPSESDSTEGG
jgi:hypothetical protein